ncbi:MAG: outer membrane receptor for ferrienterochelin and colicins [Alteromonadaceae bacterium]|jgi:outer membrane receptor for ferrienterochelin and colicins
MYVSQLKIAITLLLFSLSSATFSHEVDEDIYSLSIEQLIDMRIEGASGFEEKASEAPTPVTIITEQMINNAGVSSIRDLLTLYVPSFTQVQDQNEYNVAIRGIYTSSQQKFLVLLNNHRLNSRAYSMANPDHAISLEKVQRIEIIRGPGSSVYGNVALTGVVNVITKDAHQAPGLSTSVEVGNYGYRDFYLQYGGYGPTLDYFGWFKFIQTDGEPFTISPQDDYSPTPHDFAVTTRLDAFNSEPSIDSGITLDFSNDVSMLLNYRQSHYREPLTAGAISGEAYVLNSVSNVNGVAPGTQSSWLHSLIKKDWHLGDANKLSLKAYYDTNEISGPVMTQGLTSSFVDVAWKEYDYGINAKWLQPFGDNLLMMGVDYDKTKLWFSQAIAGANGVINGVLLFDGEPVLRLGSESTASVYLQYKYWLSDQWLINGGFRYDNKDRLTGPGVSEISPRAAAIYQGSDHTVKFSYSRSFVDPPYWNRYSKFRSFRGSTNLKPEILESYQITPELVFFDKRLQVRLNLYANEYKEVVFRRTTATRDQPLFVNSGGLKSLGFEQELSWQADPFKFRFIASHYNVTSVEGYSADDNEIFNIPRTQFNLIMDHQLTEQLSYQLSAKYLGNRRSPINVALNNIPVADPFPTQGVDFFDLDNRLSHVYLFNLNLRWKPKVWPVTLTFNAQNLFDKNWQQGGSVVHPYQQTGRWFKFGLEYPFN